MPASPAFSLSHPKYRPDIDGLRAIAVLSVVFFHAFPRVLSGGYIGVDIFFVISGFLISTIIFENLERGSFSFAGFYARRIKRIFPALSLVLLTCIGIGWFALLPDEYRQLGRHLWGGATFLSNFILWKEAGYFDAGADTKPLLHLWSLGIEEQFYIVFPCLIWLTWKLRLNPLTVTAALALTSFVLNLKGIDQDATATFYAPHTRFWELLGGSLLAWLTLHPSPLLNRLAGGLDRSLGRLLCRPAPPADGRLLASLAAGLGLLLVIYGVIRLNTRHTIFPGHWALVPVVGAWLLIAAGPRAWINRQLLSNKAMVWFGLISFPLYLWHWPLLSFARIMQSETPSVTIRLSAIVLAILLAWLTYRLVERRVRAEGNTGAKVTLLVVTMVAVGVSGYVVYRTDGFSYRFPKIIQTLVNVNYDYKTSYRYSTCFLTHKQNYQAFSRCIPETGGTGKSLLLWGDSHAAHLYPGYKAVYGKSYAIIQRTTGGCPPILDLGIANRMYCENINREIFADLRKHPPTRVVLTANWLMYDFNALDKKLDDTIMQLQRAGVKNIDLIGPVPQWLDGLPKQLYTAYAKDPQHRVPYRMSTGLDQRVPPIDVALRQKAARLGINFISPEEILCDARGCLTRLGDADESLITWDYGHLTSQGSAFLVARFPKPQD